MILNISRLTSSKILRGKKPEEIILNVAHLEACLEDMLFHPFKLMCQEYYNTPLHLD